MTRATAMPAATACARGPIDRGAGPQTLAATLALGFAVAMGVWILGTPQPADPALPEAVLAMAPAPVRPIVAAATPRRPSRPVPVPYTYNALLDPAFSLGGTPATLADSAPLAADFAWAAPMQVAAAEPSAVPEPSVAPPSLPVAADDAPAPPPSLPVVPPVLPHLAEDVPLPTPRPSIVRQPPTATPLRPPARQFAQATRRSVARAAPVDNRSFFEKIFGGPVEPTGPALAYAAPESDLFDNGRRLNAGPPMSDDRHTAVYDISAHTVYMPDGSRLEAHSGLGGMLDDPHSVHQRNRGATPPHLYQLTLREQMFHGVQALRLNPVGGGGVYGRDGLLAHTFMLGPNGDSNGCVSFRNYRAFLEAFRNGQISQLSVVAGG